MLLQQDGCFANHKRIWRLYSKAGLSVRKRRRKRIAAVERTPLPLPTGPNQSGSMDFVSDGLAYGRRFRYLNVVGDYTRECLVIAVDTSQPGLRVQRGRAHGEMQCASCQRANDDQPVVLRSIGQAC
ncbi:putative integrase, catalytic domain protein [Burkholderia pseudomallei MSHR5492]|nr:putative integrase, catalytic domain protein [Burkholderia pseudomallei]KGD10390.1 putative integrase, catalytic domain protein [Burkholderia pseudomallei]KGS35857.1 putative integrase, catalytic domain protein [Burkholderia pseudomallei MSHR5492]